MEFCDAFCFGFLTTKVIKKSTLLPTMIFIKMFSLLMNIVYIICTCFCVLNVFNVVKIMISSEKKKQQQKNKKRTKQKTFFTSSCFIIAFPHLSYSTPLSSSYLQSLYPPPISPLIMIIITNMYDDEHVVVLLVQQNNIIQK